MTEAETNLDRLFPKIDKQRTHAWGGSKKKITCLRCGMTWEEFDDNPQKCVATRAIVGNTQGGYDNKTTSN